MSRFLGFFRFAIILLPFLFLAWPSEVVIGQDRPVSPVPPLPPLLAPSPTPPLTKERPKPDELIRFPPATQTGSLGGTLTDKNGAVIPGATITAVNKKTGQQYPPVMTDDSGHFTIPGLPPGDYYVIVSVPNLRPRQVTAAVNFGQTSSLDINVDDTQPYHGSVATQPPQPGKLSGSVLKANYAGAIRRAEVTISEVNLPYSSFVLSTNGRGKFAKSGLSPGKYKVTVKASGFGDAQQVVDLAERENKVLSFILTPK